MTTRQEHILLKIVETYIETGEPVGSKSLISKYHLNFSSATIRNDMAALEKEGYLEKSHTSSGRVPSRLGYEFFARQDLLNQDEALEQKLKDVFAKRHFSIDITIDEAAKAITEIAGLTLVTTNSETDELMKSIHLTPINSKMATIVIVTSTGRVESKVIELNTWVKLSDIKVAVRLFKDRLVDKKLSELALNVEMLSPLLAKKVKNYEALIQAFVGKVFDFHNKVKNKVYGNTNIIESDISRHDLAKLIDLMQTKSIWSTIENHAEDDKSLKIDIRSNNTSIISKKISSDKKTTEISVVGSNRMDYGNAKKAIAILEKLIKGEPHE